ncbi:MAG: hypothetical protein E7624_01400 [Ruminococcaceae bacterium]|nr:hypothetical protein [Oscillospiraceae bacterium]
MKRILAFLLCLLMLFAVGCQQGPVEKEPSPIPGETVVKDGITQNSLRFLDSIYYADGKLHYSIINQTSYDCNLAMMNISPIVEKWENDTWVYYPLIGGIIWDSWAPAFSEREGSLTVSARALAAGRYRLVLGDQSTGMDKSGTYIIQRSENKSYFVGYFNIEGSQIPADRPSDLYFAEGCLQSSKVSLFITNVEHHLFHYEYRLHNHGEKTLVVEILNLNDYNPKYDTALLQMANTRYKHYSTWQRFPEEITRIPPNQTWALPFQINVAADPADQYELADGSYLFYLQCYWEGEEEYFFTAQVFFDVVNGQIA